MRGAMLALAVAVGFLVSGARAAVVDVEVRDVVLDGATGSPVVRLVEKRSRGGARRELPIWIGPAEARAIALEMQGLPPPRPLTHDLMREVIERLGGKLRRVVIVDLRDNTYYAKVHLAGADGRALAVDARPSDAIALALRLDAPIRVREKLFAKAAPAEPSAALHLWGLTVQDLTPEIATFFADAGDAGVLVADVARGAPARGVRRGDVITALDDRPVASVDELASRVDARRSAEPVNLSLRRDGHPLTVRFAAE